MQIPTIPPFPSPPDPANAPPEPRPTKDKDGREGVLIPLADGTSATIYPARSRRLPMPRVANATTAKELPR